MDLSKFQTTTGYIKIAAMDHRGSLQKVMDESKLSEFKNLLVENLAPYSTSILVDPKYGEQAIENAKSKNLGVMLSREKTGYTDHPDGRITELLTDFDTIKLKDMGADGIKLLVYYNHDASNANSQIEVVKKVRDETNAANIPLLVEPITYPVEGFEYNKGDAIVQASKDLHQFCDILKIEFPMEVDKELPANEINFEAASPYLSAIDETVDAPWILLSLGMPFEHYRQALTLCKSKGCSGFAVGRAVWQEISDAKDWDGIVNLLETTAIERMKILSDIYDN